MLFQEDLIDGSKKWSGSQLRHLCVAVGVPPYGSESSMLDRLAQVHIPAADLLRELARPKDDDFESDPADSYDVRHKMKKKPRNIVFCPFVQIRTIPCRKGTDNEAGFIPPTA